MVETLEIREVTRSEALRFETLDHYEVLGTVSDPAIDDLVELAAKACNATVAGVSFAAADRICLYSRYGIRETELPQGNRSSFQCHSFSAIIIQFHPAELDRQQANAL